MTPSSLDHIKNEDFLPAEEGFEESPTVGDQTDIACPSSDSSDEGDENNSVPPLYIEPDSRTEDEECFSGAQGLSNLPSTNTISVRRGSEGGEEHRRFKISLIKDSPEVTKTTAIATLQHFDMGDVLGFGRALSTHDAFAGVSWKNGEPSSKTFDGADVVVVEWDMPDHSHPLPVSLHNPEALIQFVTNLCPSNVPMPNFVYATAHGIRMIYILKEPITTPGEYHKVALRLAADFEADFNGASVAAIFRSRVHLARSPLVQVHSKPLAVKKYLETPPSWSLDGDDDGKYRDALAHFELEIGRSYSTEKSPEGGYSQRGKNGLRVYPTGVMDYVKNHFINRNRIIELAGMKSNGLSLYDLAKSDVMRFAPGSGKFQERCRIYFLSGLIS